MHSRTGTVQNGRPLRQRGYATIFTLLLFVAVALAVFSMYDIGQTNADKVRLQNAADAAAYSGANMMARDFNFMAYTNRAMVANQAAIGQMVGLSSWTAQLDTSTRNIRVVASLASAIPVAGPIINAAATALDRATRALNQVVERVGAGVITALDGVSTVLSRSQQIHHASTLASVPSTLKEVLKENDPDASLGLAGNALFWRDFLGAWEGWVKRNTSSDLSRNRQKRDFTIDRFKEFTQIVEHSTDGFTHERKERWFDERIPFFLDVKIDKRGGNEFDMRHNRRRKRLEWDWSAIDTESFYTRTWEWGLFSSGWGSWTEIPLGWGAAHGKDRNTRGNTFNYSSRRGDRWGDAWENSSAAASAQVEFGNNNTRKIKGLQGFYDFARDRNPEYNAKLEPGDTSKGPSLGVFTHKSSSDITTTSSLADKHDGFADSAALDIEEQGGTASDRIGALARAELYFKRPADLWPKQGTRESRYSGKHEHGNLYNPHWQVRQTTPTTAQRAIALARAFGLGSLPF